MNRHRSNWSAMGAGLTGTYEATPITSTEDCKEILMKIFKETPLHFEQLTNICEALKEIKEDLNI